MNNITIIEESSKEYEHWRNKIIEISNGNNFINITTLKIEKLSNFFFKKNFFFKISF